MSSQQFTITVAPSGAAKATTEEEEVVLTNPKGESVKVGKDDSRRLSQQIRLTILENAMNKSDFLTARKALMKRENQLAMEVVEKLTPKDVFPLLAKHPEAFSREAMITINLNGQTRNIYLLDKAKATQKRRDYYSDEVSVTDYTMYASDHYNNSFSTDDLPALPRHLVRGHGSPPVVSRDNPKTKYLANKLGELFEEIDDLNEKYNEAKSAIWAVLNSVQTTKQLLIVWPECAPFVPSPPIKAGLPTVDMSKINSLLGLGKKSK